MFDDPPYRTRADQPGEEFPDSRRYDDWSDIERTSTAETPAEPPQAAPEPPRPPVLRKVYDADAVEPEPVEAPKPPNLLALARNWAQRRLFDVEAELRYRRLVDKEDR